MKILVLNYEFPPIGGGAGVVSYDISKMLAARGHKVTIVTMGFNGLPFYEQKDGLEIYRVKCIRRKKAVCYPWEQLSYIISAAYFLQKHLQKHCYDINHTHFIIPTGAISWWLKKKYGLSYVITSHGSDVDGYNQKRFRFLHKILKGFWRKIVEEAGEVISPSQYLQGLLQKSGPGLKCYPIVPNGIELDIYRPLMSVKKENHIIVMCRLQEAKNVQTVIRAFAKLQRKMCDQIWTLDILGDGPYREQLEILVKELEEEHVVFHGWLSNRSQRQLELLGQAKIYVSASMFENCPMSLLEAMAAGLYPLVSDIPAHRQIISDEALRFPIWDATALAEKLEMVICEKGPALSFDIDKYDWETVILQYEKILGC